MALHREVPDHSGPVHVCFRRRHDPAKGWHTCGLCGESFTSSEQWDRAVRALKLLG